MKATEVQIGETYRCKVSGVEVDVRITAVDPAGGWIAVNTLSKRAVRIKKASRLLGKPAPRPKRRQRIVSLAQYHGHAEAGVKAAAGKRAVARAADLDKAMAPAKAKAGPSKRPAARGNMSGLDAAAQVLARAKKPMTAQAIVDAMLKAKLWKTRGKTPAATIYAAMVREIAAKGKDARFAKTAPGMFARKAS